MVENDNLGVLVVEAVDDVLDLFAELELLELVQALLGDFDTGGLTERQSDGRVGGGFAVVMRIVCSR